MDFCCPLPRHQSCRHWRFKCNFKINLRPLLVSRQLLFFVLEQWLDIICSVARLINFNVQKHDNIIMLCLDNLSKGLDVMFSGTEILMMFVCYIIDASFKGHLANLNIQLSDSIVYSHLLRVCFVVRWCHHSYQSCAVSQTSLAQPKLETPETTAPWHATIS